MVPHIGSMSIVPMEYSLSCPSYSNDPNYEFSVLSAAPGIPCTSPEPTRVAYASSGDIDTASQPVYPQWTPNSMYRCGEARSYHTDFNEQSRCQVNISSYCTHSSVPLHAPVPVHGHVPCLEPNVAVADSGHLSTISEQPTDVTTYGSYSPPAALPLELNYDYTDGAPVPGSFPTPSELLAELASREATITDEQLGLDNGPETARKARRRAMAKSVGFIPTDPDTISSHDKKRHYLECLELYVTYLHQQLNIVGIQPAPLERVQNYRGLSSRSIRTLLVHMENTTRKLNLQILKEEQRFASLRDAVYQYSSSSQCEEGQAQSQAASSSLAHG